MTITVTSASDRTRATIEVDGRAAELDTDALSAFIAELVAVRAGMSPVHGGAFTPGETPAFDCDNLLWDTMPDPSRRAILLALHHGGLGWVTCKLSRAQIEDLVTSFEFSLLELARAQDTHGTPPGTEETGNHEPVPLLRAVGA